MEQADTIAAAGVTTIWLPPPTDSVSQQGYMPTDLYNLNSRYGSEDELRRWDTPCGGGMLAGCMQAAQPQPPSCMVPVVAAGSPRSGACRCCQIGC